MNIVKTVTELRSWTAEQRAKGNRISFVPTMGYLHEGHMSLVDLAKQHADVVVMSIFVNPLQFGPNEDLERYPRDLERDQVMAEKRGVDLLFVPDVKEMYPQETKTVIQVKGVTDRLCGASRPGHFDGVATVVCKLFNMVQPDSAFFGQKDAQQVAVIQQMVQDLNIPVQVIPCPIVREKDGLAMSSRNVYLKEEERIQALSLSQSLQEARDAYSKGKTPAEIRELIIARISSQPLADIDYVEVLAYPSLEPIEEFGDTSFLIALAVRFGKTRLIDNLMMT
ncbi:pantoate--beta-alanine ligase [Ammoniphilus sp. CFH 90114]|uniref:pantoate--beta-alanine ligase n=1 Tax=Ammoniphilus sp. CFH 90114 TaxID=2493665 RepID=UPI00100F38E0|nr:pantoate--beta-alanine ligase [Ammoniphilus sp. CFH 90114]RXT13945.1 pantoate--beta-alanine ligase [Ammoniphilus sp. CFH 90114]